MDPLIPDGRLRFFLYCNMSQCMRFQQCGMCDQQSLRSACAYTQSDQSLYLSLKYPMSVKLLTEHHLRFISLKGCCTGSSESTLVLEITCHSSYYCQCSKGSSLQTLHCSKLVGDGRISDKVDFNLKIR